MVGFPPQGTPTATPSNTVVNETAFGQAPAPGVVVALSRGDHTHGTPPVIPGTVPSNTVQTETGFGQAPAAGAALTFSRGDHTHGTPLAPVIPIASGAVQSEIAFGQASNAGAAITFSRGDHTHGTPAAPTVPDPALSVETETAFGQAQAIGVSTRYARQDHTHGTPSSAGLATLDGNSEVTPAQVRNFARYAGFVDYTTPVSGPGTITVPNKDIYFFEGGVMSDRLVKYTLTGGTTGTELPALTDLTANYLVGWYNGGAPIFTIVTDVTLIDNLEYIHYCMVYRSGNNLHTEECRLTNKSLSERLVDRFYYTHKYGHESGLYIGIQDNAGTPEYMISEGVVWIGANRITLPQIDYDLSSFFCHLDAGVWHNEYRAGNTDINNTQYQGATDLVTLTDTYYTVNHIYRGVEAQLHNYILLSTSEYATEELALASPVVTNLPTLVTSHAVFVGRIIIQKGATTGTIQSAFAETFGTTSGITDHNTMSGKQGGTVDEYYHSTLAEYTGTGTNNFVRETSPTITTPTTVFSPSIGVDLTAHGDIFPDTVGENVVFGNILYLESDGKWWKADATQATTMPCTAMAIATILADATGNLLSRGFVRNDAWNWTIGATSGLIYASTTPGAPSQTAPSLSGEQVQILGFARTPDIMFFNPSYNIVELV
jgi:hypothetical protein